MSKRGLIREDSSEPSVKPSDAHAINELSRAHGDYLRGLARRLCRTQYDPDDLVQDTFLRTLKSPIPAGANERAWLARVMHNLFIDTIRRRGARREEELVDLAAPARDPDEEWWKSLSSEDVRTAVARLPEDQRIVFTMFAFDGKSYLEIAESQGIQKATVGTRILRARQRIRELLQKEHRDE
jgi:RNA polymerase sigma-70 factor (ECF subfamily)